MRSSILRLLPCFAVCSLVRFFQLPAAAQLPAVPIPGSQPAADQTPGAPNPAALVPTPGPDRATPNLPGWKVVWSDEFNYTGLPDPAKWGYEEGYIRNGEKQYYTRGRLENARVENGMLVIEGRKEAFDISHLPHNNGKATTEYTSASLTTQHKASWTYGRIEVRAKLPDGKGTWPAIWMLGDNVSQVNWPRCGEIDIMEYVGKEPNIDLGTLHWYGVDPKTGRPGHQFKYAKLTVPNLAASFHVFAAEWSPEKIDLSCDGRLIQSFPVDNAGAGENNAFRKPQYLILNLALGGGMAGAIDPGLPFPRKYLIDYVRVYQRAD